MSNTPNKKFKDSPILNNPYKSPSLHWKLDERGRMIDELVTGRRQSLPYLPVPKADNEGTGNGTQKMTEPYITVNIIREMVDEWSANGYPGISINTSNLLEYWINGSPNMKPYFCQLEAIKTLIFLCEADYPNPKLDQIKKNLQKINKRWNDDILRHAVKMATATGKTVVMAMIILWQAFLSKERTDVLVITPNLTVKYRLRIDLDPNGTEPIYKELLPRNMTMKQNLKITIKNYQAFQLRDKRLEGFPDTTLTKLTKTLLKSDKENDELEPPEKMLGRVLQKHRGAKKIIIINDEAHHCYKEDNMGNSSNGKEDTVRADMWFGVLKMIKNEQRLDSVFDMSATPMYGKKPVDLDNELFPWIVSDYPLIEAMEAGLTKIPVVPVKDDTNSDEPSYRNIFDSIEKNERVLNHKKMPKLIQEVLQGFYEEYEDKCREYVDKIPVMIVVANSVYNANEFYKYLAGYKDEKTGKWIKGNFDIFSNVKEDGSGPVDYPPTLVVHSDMDAGIDGNHLKSIEEIQRDFFSIGEKATKTQNMEHIRNTFMSVGNIKKPGGRIRCVISVSMLTEGWDVKTVTNILGFRPFSSQLLCEQVAGRALRRSTKFLQFEQSLPHTEYATICGVPFTFIPGDAKPSKPSPGESWSVHTVQNRAKYRITFPNIKSFMIEQPSKIFELDKEKVQKYTVINSGNPIETYLVGSIGKETIMKVAGRTENESIYKIAKAAMDKFKGEDDKGQFKRNRSLFGSMVMAVKEWLDHPNVICEDRRFLTEGNNMEIIPEQIVNCCKTVTNNSKIILEFMDDGGYGHPHSIDTSDVNFDTILKHRYPKSKEKVTKKSELNAAACHSQPEVIVAEMLDLHNDVISWVRNFRLDWTIPYMNKKTGKWKSYEPDFIAKIKRKSGMPGYLIIEFKGQKSEESDTKTEYVSKYWIPAVNESDDPVCEGKWGYVVINSTEHLRNNIQKNIDEGIKNLNEVDA